MSNVECKEEKDTEMLRFRVHQYTENPTMKLSGEEIQMVMEWDNCGPGVLNVYWWTVMSVGQAG